MPKMARQRGSDEGQSRRNSQILQRVFAGAARRIVSFYPALVRGPEKAVTVAAESGQFTADETGKGQFLARKLKESGRRGSSEKVKTGTWLSS